MNSLFPAVLQGRGGEDVCTENVCYILFSPCNWNAYIYFKKYWALISAYILLFLLCGNMWRECKDPLTTLYSTMQHKIPYFYVSHKCHSEKSKRSLLNSFIFSDIPLLPFSTSLKVSAHNIELILQTNLLDHPDFFSNINLLLLPDFTAHWSLLIYVLQLYLNPPKIPY